MAGKTYASFGTARPAMITQNAGFGSALTLVRTADTDAYTAADVLGSAVAAGGAVLAFPDMAPSGGGRISIVSASHLVGATAVPAGMTTFFLHLYNVTPPSDLGDNGAFDIPEGDRAAYLGSIALGTPVDVGSTLYVEAATFNKELLLSSSTLYAYLVTTGGYTPASGTTHIVRLNAKAA